MTTICVKDKIVAADTQCSVEDGTIQPLYKLEVQEINYGADNEIVVTCGVGSLLMTQKMRDWWNEGCDAEKMPEPPSEDDIWESCFYVITATEIEEYHTGRLPDKITYQHDYPFAVGTGRQGAMVAMEMGATAEEAVKMASKYDVSTNDDIQVVELEPKRKQSK